MAQTTAIPGNIGTTDKTRTVPNLDSRYGPYASVTDALNVLGRPNNVIACDGLTVGIITSDGVEDYVFTGTSGLQILNTSNLIKKVNNPQISLLVENTEAGHFNLNQQQPQSINLTLPNSVVYYEEITNNETNNSYN